MLLYVIDLIGVAVFLALSDGIGAGKPAVRGSRTALAAVLSLLSACAGASQTAPPPSGQALPGGATLMLDDGWWLQVRRDGEHAIGFGALAARIPVASSAVDAEQLLELVSRNARPGAPTPDVEDRCRYTVTFSDGTGLVHALPADLCDTLAGAFRSAWEERLPASSTMGGTDVIERAWRSAPFLAQRYM